ncbi:MAG: family acetyltransferase [Paenibacillus sp.]|jgi:RimJ/RimL family protein N-acetyltransferase|uniref:GNAT family N-acetyltransferase n=1 Tax=Paenibacillus sp. GCM10012303 TaxID=3317340 RepID=UPI0029F2C90A|nr:family acetyltransferase [Paenibacillus sp.]
MDLINTARLRIRPYEKEEFVSIHRILSDPVTMHFWPLPFTEEQTSGWIRRSLDSYAAWGFGRAVIELKETGEVIGDGGLMKAELDGTTENDLGYIIYSPYWHQGYGYEAAQAILDYGFVHLGLHRICSNMPIDHHASRRVAEKLGMTLEKEYINRRNRNIRTYLFAKETAEKA